MYATAFVAVADPIASVIGTAPVTTIVVRCPLMVFVIEEVVSDCEKVVSEPEVISVTNDGLTAGLRVVACPSRVVVRAVG